MALIWNGDLSTGNLSQWGGVEYVGTFSNSPPVSSRVQVSQNISGATGVGGSGYFMRVTVKPGDQYGSSTGWRCLLRQTEPLVVHDAGYDSSFTYAMRMPSGYPNGANMWVSGREWHHTGGNVAPSHFIMQSGNGTIDVFGGQESNKTTYVNQTILSGYTQGAWYLFTERYKHGLAPNGHFELWAAKVGTDSSMTRIVYAPNIGTMYQGFGNYMLFGIYRAQSGSNDVYVDFGRAREYTSLTEALAYANGLLTGSTPSPDPPPAPEEPPAESELPALAHDRRIGKTTIGGGRNGFSGNFKSGSKFPTGLAAGEEGDAKKFHIAIQGGDNSASTQNLKFCLYKDDGTGGKAGTLIGTCDQTWTPAGNQDMQWVSKTAGTPIRFTGQNVWMLVLADTPTNRSLYATDVVTNGLLYNADTYSGGAADPAGTMSYDNIEMSIALDYDVVSGTSVPPGDSTAPTLDSATVVSDLLTLEYSEPLDEGSSPVVSDLVVKVGGSPVSVVGAQVLGSRVTISLTEAVIDTDTVTVSYTAGTSPIQDIAGNNAANLTNQAVTNNTPDVSEPAITSRPTAITKTSATLNGTVNPNGIESVAYFEYGPTTSYGSSTTPQNVGDGVLPVAFSAQIVGLTPHATYHYRTVRDDA